MHSQVVMGQRDAAVSQIFNATEFASRSEFISLALAATFNDAYECSYFIDFFTEIKMPLKQQQLFEFYDIQLRRVRHLRETVGTYDGKFHGRYSMYIFTLSSSISQWTKTKA